MPHPLHWLMLPFYLRISSVLVVKLYRPTDRFITLCHTFFTLSSKNPPPANNSVSIEHMTVMINSSSFEVNNLHYRFAKKLCIVHSLYRKEKWYLCGLWSGSLWYILNYGIVAWKKEWLNLVRGWRRPSRPPIYFCDFLLWFCLSLRKNLAEVLLYLTDSR